MIAPFEWTRWLQCNGGAEAGDKWMACVTCATLLISLSGCTRGVAMALDKEIDLRAAINAVSDVVQNRPRPLREFDQIYMKTGDMV
jgi:hypothetical protein